jgi:hypothetical protein
MQETYHGHGLRFRYPAHWELTEQDGEGSASITVSSPETAFWSVSLLFDRPSSSDVIEGAVAAFREEYQEVDDYPADVAGDRETVARDVDFVCFELVSSAFLRAFQTERFTVLVLYQGFDGELETARPLMEAISDSLALDEDESG